MANEMSPTEPFSDSDAALVLLGLHQSEGVNTPQGSNTMNVTAETEVSQPPQEPSSTPVDTPQVQVSSPRSDEWGFLSRMYSDPNQVDTPQEDTSTLCGNSDTPHSVETHRLNSSLTPTPEAHLDPISALASSMQRAQHQRHLEDARLELAPLKLAPLSRHIHFPRAYRLLRCRLRPERTIRLTNKRTLTDPVPEPPLKRKLLGRRRHPNLDRSLQTRAFKTLNNAALVDPSGPRQPDKVWGTRMRHKMEEGRCEAQGDEQWARVVEVDEEWRRVRTWGKRRGSALRNEVSMDSEAEKERESQSTWSGSDSWCD